MKYRLILPVNVKAEIDEAAAYIAEHSSPHRAASWIRGIYAVIQDLINLPRSYAPAREQSAYPHIGLRQTVYKSHRVIFEVDEDAGEVRVVLLHHTARLNWDPET